MKCSLDNETELFSNCTNISTTDVHKLALVRGAAGIACFILCVATFVFELLYICRLKRQRKKNAPSRNSEGTTTLQRLFVYLTFSNILYTAALSLHIEEYFPHQRSAVDCFVCRAVGFFDQYSGSVQLLLTVGISVKLFHKLQSFKPKVVEGVLSRHHFKFEALFVFLCFFFPLVVIWVPFTQHGAGEYGLDGAWCWIQVIEVGCQRSQTGFLEQLFLWYVPYAVVSLISLFCVAVIIIFLVYIYVNHRSYKNLSRLICDMLLLLPFLVVLSCVCLVEVTILILFQLKESKNLVHLDSYMMWMSYAVITPVGGVVIPIAFFFYHLRKKNFVSESRKLEIISDAQGRTNPPSCRQTVNSDSQEGRPGFLSPSSWSTSTGSCVVVNSAKFKYGTMD